MDLFLREIGEYIERGYNIEEITKKITKYMKKKDVIYRILPSEIVILIRSFIDDTYLIPAIQMLFGGNMDYPGYNIKGHNNKILEKMSILLVNNSININDCLIYKFFIDYLSLKTRDIHITENLLKKYRNNFCFDECFDFSMVKTLEERQLFEQYRDILGACYYYEGKFPWEHPIGTFI